MQVIKKNYRVEVEKSVILQSDVNSLKEWKRPHEDKCSSEHRAIIERVEAESASIRDLIATNELAAEGKRKDMYQTINKLSDQVSHLTGYLEAKLGKGA